MKKILIEYSIPIIASLLITSIIAFAASVFPTSLDSLPTVSTGDIISADSWNNVVGGINNLQIKVGVDGSAVASSLDSLIKNSSSTLYRIAKTDGGFVVGDGTNWVIESGATALTSLGVISSNWKTLTVNAITPTSTIGLIVNASSTFSYLNGNLNGNASSSSALFANGSNCTIGNYPLGIDASGNVENCTAVSTSNDGSSNWQFIGLNAIRPTSTMGIIVSASSTIAGDLTVNYGFISATGTFSGKILANGGFISQASSTIANNLTISGNATSTGNLSIPRDYGISLFYSWASTTATTTRSSFTMPFNGTTTAAHCEVSTASTAQVVTFDINKNGSTILDTKITIDANETGSDTAATPHIFNGTEGALLKYDQFTIDVDSAGTGTLGGHCIISFREFSR